MKVVQGEIPLHVTYVWPKVGGDNHILKCMNRTHLFKFCLMYVDMTTVECFTGHNVTNCSGQLQKFSDDDTIICFLSGCDSWVVEPGFFLVEEPRF